MTVQETTTIDSLARSPEGRLLMAMTEERPYTPTGDEPLVEDLRLKLNAYVYALRSGQITVRQPGQPVDIVLYTMSEPTPAVLEMLRVAHDALGGEGVTVGWRRLPDPGPRPVQTMIVDISRYLRGAFPANWATGRYGATLIGEEARDSLLVTDAAGRTTQLAVPQYIRELVAELKRAMWTPERGTWFGIVLALDNAAGQVAPGYNYDTEPSGPPFPREQWIAEMRQFPRPPDAVPDWLTSLLEG